MPRTYASNESDEELEKQALEGSEEEESVLETPVIGNLDAQARAMAMRKAREDYMVSESGLSGSAAYEDLLGSTLGSQLYGAVSDAITLESLADYARNGLESGLGRLGDLAKSRDPINEDKIDAAVDHLEKSLGPLAREFVLVNGEGIQSRMQNFVDVNPLAVTSVALLAAAAAVASDMSLPELKKTFQVGNAFDLSVGARLGTIRNIAVKKITARIEYISNELRARLEASYRPQEDMLSGTASFDYRMSDNLDIYGQGSWRVDGLRSDDDRAIEPGYGRIGARWRPNKNSGVEGYVQGDEHGRVSGGINAWIRF